MKQVLCVYPYETNMLSINSSFHHSIAILRNLLKKGGSLIENILSSYKKWSYVPILPTLFVFVSETRYQYF